MAGNASLRRAGPGQQVAPGGDFIIQSKEVKANTVVVSVHVGVFFLFPFFPPLNPPFLKQCFLIKMWVSYPEHTACSEKHASGYF